MFTAEHFRTKVTESAESIKNSDNPNDIRKFQRSMESFGQLARNEDWLADNFDKMVHFQHVLSKDETVGSRSTARPSGKWTNIFCGVSAQP